MDKLKKLLDELAAVVAEMEATSQAPAEGDAPAMTEEQEASLRSLEQKADKLRSQIEFVQRVQAKELELRSVLERAAPAKAIEKTEAPEVKEPTVEKRHFAIPRATGRLKAFGGPNAEERAYRAGMHLKVLATLTSSQVARQNQHQPQQQSNRLPRQTRKQESE